MPAFNYRLLLVPPPPKKKNMLEIPDLDDHDGYQITNLHREERALIFGSETASVCSESYLHCASRHECVNSLQVRHRRQGSLRLGVLGRQGEERRDPQGDTGRGSFGFDPKRHPLKRIRKLVTLARSEILEEK